jgi:hypothetical protein
MLVKASLKILRLTSVGFVHLSNYHSLMPSPVSFTGSEHVGRKVGKKVQSRFGKVLLELGGNNGKERWTYLGRMYLIFLRIQQLPSLCRMPT